MAKSTKKEQPMKDLSVENAEQVKGGADALHLLAQVNHLASQTANDSSKSAAAATHKRI